MGVYSGNTPPPGSAIILIEARPSDMVFHTHPPTQNKDQLYCPYCSEWMTTAKKVGKIECPQCGKRWSYTRVECDRWVLQADCLS